MFANAGSIFSERGERLFLLTSRHIVVEEQTHHFPDRIEIELHTDPQTSQIVRFSIPLYQQGKEAPGRRFKVR